MKKLGCSSDARPEISVRSRSFDHRSCYVSFSVFVVTFVLSYFVPVYFSVFLTQKGEVDARLLLEGKKSM